MTLLNNLKVQERQNRVCTTVAIAIVAETCSPFTVLPALMNEYKVRTHRCCILSRRMCYCLECCRCVDMTVADAAQQQCIQLCCRCPALAHMLCCHKFVHEHRLWRGAPKSSRQKCLLLSFPFHTAQNSLEQYSGPESVSFTVICHTLCLKLMPLPRRRCRS